MKGHLCLCRCGHYVYIQIDCIEYEQSCEYQARTPKFSQNDSGFGSRPCKGWSGHISHSGHLTKHRTIEPTKIKDDYLNQSGTDRAACHPTQNRKSTKCRPHPPTSTSGKSTPSSPTSPSPPRSSQSAAPSPSSSRNTNERVVISAQDKAPRGDD